MKTFKKYTFILILSASSVNGICGKLHYKGDEVYKITDIHNEESNDMCRVEAEKLKIVNLKRDDGGLKVTGLIYEYDGKHREFINVSWDGNEPMVYQENLQYVFEESLNKGNN